MATAVPLRPMVNVADLNGSASTQIVRPQLVDSDRINVGGNQSRMNCPLTPWRHHLEDNVDSGHRLEAGTLPISSDHWNSKRQVCRTCGNSFIVDNEQSQDESVQEGSNDGQCISAVCHHHEKDVHRNREAAKEARAAHDDLKEIAPPTKIIKRDCTNRSRGES